VESAAAGSVCFLTFGRGRTRAGELEATATAASALRQSLATGGGVLGPGGAMGGLVVLGEAPAWSARRGGGPDLGGAMGLAGPCWASCGGAARACGLGAWELRRRVALATVVTCWLRAAGGPRLEVVCWLEEVRGA
jgi:hypothetical protein